MGGLVCWAIAGIMLAECHAPLERRFEFTQTEMAVPIRIVIYSVDDATAKRAAKAVFARFRQLNDIMSDFDPESELRRLCDTSGGGKAVHVSNDLWRVLCRAQQISEQSAGAFDVTIGPLVRPWRNARHTKELPSAKTLADARERVGYRFMRLNPDEKTVELLRPRMRLDLGGIAKGYAVDEGMKVLREKGIACAMIDAGGNIGLGSPPPGKSGWRIGIAPAEVNGPPRMYLSLSNTNISTSGDLWQHVIIDGVRYSHLIDPRTGRALTNGVSATVICTDGTTADALSSAIAVLGPENGIALADKTPGAAALVVVLEAGKQWVYESAGWKKLVEQVANQSD